MGSRILKRSLLVLLVGLLGYDIYYATQALPILSGYGAKCLCSSALLAGREPESVKSVELGGSLLSLGTFSVSYDDSSTTGHVLGMAPRKAIFRKGLGCTLLSEIKEAELRAQRFSLPALPSFDPDTVAWPTGNLMSDSSLAYPKLDPILEEAFSEPTEKKSRQTRAVIVVHHGEIAAERYAPGFDRNSRLTGWSMTKSITNALIGVLVRQGRLNVDQPAPIESWKDDNRATITLNDLMHASSGLDWKEVYGGPSSATNMLFRKKDMGAFAAESPLAHEPGTDFYYSSGTTNILSRIIRNTVGDESYYRFPYEQVLYKIGMLSATLEPDAGGTFVGSSYTFATARDWARFGLLYLNDGVWNDERILPEGWVTYTTTPASAAARGEYGAQFWLNAGAPENPQNRYFPDVPTDLFWADGYEGQNVFILPSKSLVVVKLSSSSGDYLDDNRFLAGIIQAIE